MYLVVLNCLRGIKTKISLLDYAKADKNIFYNFISAFKSLKYLNYFII